MLVGTMPFRGETAVEIALKHIKNPMPSIRKINPKVPQSLENVVLKCTAKNPKNRYNSVRELYDDLKTCLDKSRENEKRIVFPFPEDELEETKVLNDLKEEIEKKEEKKEEEKPVVKSVSEEEYKEDKKLGKFTKVLIGLVTALIVTVIMVFLVVPYFFRTPDKTVPDVTGLTVKEATNTLEKAGLKVSPDVKSDYTDEVEKGLVSKTSPKARKTVKKGAVITLYKSKGSSKIKIDDYTGENYIKTQATLEVKGIEVSIDYKSVDDKSKYKGKEDLIIDQSVKGGSSLESGDTIILYLPKIEKEYPDFIKEEWTIDEVKKFCEEYGVTLDIEEIEDDTKEEGTITYQSRPAGSIIADKVSLKIKVTKKSKNNTDGMVPYKGENESNNEDSSQ